ncbi:MAG: SDR family oxidoreductase [Pseudomonadota bacterium]
MGRLDSDIAVIAAADATHLDAIRSAYRAEGATVVVAAAGDDAEPLPADEDGWRELLKSVRERHGRLDILVNLVPTPAPGTIAATKLDEFRTAAEQTIDFVFASSRAAVMAFREAAAEGEAASGAIVNVTSFASHMGLSRGANLNAVAAAVWNLTRQFGIETGESHDRIRVNSIHVGPTPAEAAALGLPVTSVADAAEDVAAAAVYLASAAARLVTAADIVIDGGLTAGR